MQPLTYNLNINSQADVMFPEPNIYLIESISRLLPPIIRKELVLVWSKQHQQTRKMWRRSQKIPCGSPVMETCQSVSHARCPKPSTYKGNTHLKEASHQDPRLALSRQNTSWKVNKGPTYHILPQDLSFKVHPVKLISLNSLCRIPSFPSPALHTWCRKFPWRGLSSSSLPSKSVASYPSLNPGAHYTLLSVLLQIWRLSRLACLYNISVSVATASSFHPGMPQLCLIMSSSRENIPLSFHICPSWSHPLKNFPLLKIYLFKCKFKYIV